MDKRIIFYNKLKKLDRASYYVYHLKYQLAPVMMGYKPGMTLSIAKHEKRGLTQSKAVKIISALDLKVMILRETPNVFILFIYRKCLIENILQDSRKQHVLKEIGYPIHSVYAALSFLKMRYITVHCPPEIGLFLGFPVDDVKDYMNHTHKACLKCGYWQVYNNLSEAEKIFKSYDIAKENMLSQLLKELVVNS